MALPPGARLGPYEILSPLGAGGMGEVYRARDPRLGREVAVKVLASDTEISTDRLRRFEDEARAAGALNHANILSVFDVGTEASSPYVVFELLEGETLRERMERGRIPARKVVEHAVQICQGLAGAHAKGILHRDLKPENLFLTSDGRVKILDFGLAKLIQGPDLGPAPDATRTATQPGTLLGTLAYMSPEQARGGTADARSDIFAFGAVLYEMLSGRPAFRGPTAADTLSAILNSDPPPITSAAGPLPPSLERVVHRCLEKDPEERFQSARDVGFALSALSGAGASGAPSTASVVERRKRGRWWLAAMVASAALSSAVLYHRSRAASTPPARPGPITSLAVLPLANLSHDPEQEYFADGMTEALITDLSRIGSLRVVSRTSVMRYKGTEKPLPEIARELNVDGVVEGSVLRAGDRVRIMAQLIRAADDRHLWAESYERELRDILALQGAVAQDIAGQIKGQLTVHEHGQLTNRRAAKPAAYLAYVRGRYFWNKRNEESLKTATTYFEEALREDPAYAPAYSGLADSYFYRGYGFGRLPARDAMPKAKAATLKALELDETLAEAHTSLAMVSFFYDWDWPAAEREFRRAIQLNPNYATAHHIYSVFLAAMRRSDESVAEARRALEVDPLSLPVNNIVASMLIMAGRYDEAIDQCRKTLELDPSFAGAQRGLGDIYERKGMEKQAIEQYLKASALSGESPARVQELRRSYEQGGMRGFRRKELARALAEWNGWHMAATVIAGLHAYLGERDEAMKWLERAYEARSGSLIWINMDDGDRWKNLRSDQRFQDLLHRIGLPS